MVLLLPVPSQKVSNIVYVFSFYRTDVAIFVEISVSSSRSHCKDPIARLHCKVVTEKPLTITLSVNKDCACQAHDLAHILFSSHSQKVLHIYSDETSTLK